MGLRADGSNVDVDVKASRARIWQHTHAASEKTVTFVDLCGHEKYLASTIYGLTGLLPDFG
jgi:GTPase